MVREGGSEDEKKNVRLELAKLFEGARVCREDIPDRRKDVKTQKTQRWDSG